MRTHRPRHRIAVALVSAFACAGVVAIDAVVGGCSTEDFTYAPDDAGAGSDVIGASDTGALDVASGDVVNDASPPTTDASCDLKKDFANPVPLTSLNTPEQEGSARFTPDERTVFFDGVREGSLPPPLGQGNKSFDIFTATRMDGGDSFGVATRVSPPSDAGSQEYSVSITDDGTTMFFERQPTIIAVNSDIYFTKRAPDGKSFGLPTPVPGVNTPDYEANPFVRGNGTELWYVGTGPDKSIDIFFARSNAVGGLYVPSVVTEVNSKNQDYNPVISADNKTLYFASDRPLIGFTGLNIWMATRPDTNKPFDAPIAVPIINSNADDVPTWVSADGCRLYVVSDRPGGKGTQDVYVASRPAL